MPAVVTASSGIGSLEERNVPSAQESAAATTSRTPVTVASPPGRSSTATPMNPTAVPASEARARTVAARRAKHHEPRAEPRRMISEASPIGTLRSATNSVAFAPISSSPQSTVDPARAQPNRNGAVPWRISIQLLSTTPTVVNRRPAAKTGGIVSPASSIPRYVEPQRM